MPNFLIRKYGKYRKHGAAQPPASPVEAGPTLATGPLSFIGMMINSPWANSPGATRYFPYFPNFPRIPYSSYFPNFLIGKFGQNGKCGQYGKYGECRVAPGLLAPGLLAPGLLAGVPIKFNSPAAKAAPGPYWAKSPEATQHFPHFPYSPQFPNIPYFPNFAIGRIGKLG